MTKWTGVVPYDDLRSYMTLGHYGIVCQGRAYDYKVQKRFALEAAADLRIVHHDNFAPPLPGLRTHLAFFPAA